jgi:hypothetical protein
LNPGTTTRQATFTFTSPFRVSSQHSWTFVPRSGEKGCRKGGRDGATRWTAPITAAKTTGAIGTVRRKHRRRGCAQRFSSSLARLPARWAPQMPACRAAAGSHLRAVPLLFYAESKVIGPRAQGCTRTTKCHAHETGAVATTKASFKELDQSTQVSNTLCMIY